MKVLFLTEGCCLYTIGEEWEAKDNWIKDYRKENGTEGPFKRKKDEDNAYFEARQAYFKENNNGLDFTNPTRSAMVARIVKETGCKIVWAAAKRNDSCYDDIQNILEHFSRIGIPAEAYIGKTPKQTNMWEDSEKLCVRFIEENPQLNIEVSAYIYGGGCPALGKAEPWRKLEKHNGRMFEVDPRFGLTDEITDNVIEYLK